MFYAHFVLSKKGPLARVWLAAHWDKKLTKAHIFETSIEGSVEAIIQPQVKLALRTSGHLLLGVVRIYSRKTKYLLADCNEACVKIKLAFRPGAVDLPEDNREAAVVAITLPETFHDFELDSVVIPEILPEFHEDEYGMPLVNQSLPEKITLREALRNYEFYSQDDGFGDFGFEDGFGMGMADIQLDRPGDQQAASLSPLGSGSRCGNGRRGRGLQDSFNDNSIPADGMDIVEEGVNELIGATATAAASTTPAATHMNIDNQENVNEDFEVTGLGGGDDGEMGGAKLFDETAMGEPLEPTVQQLDVAARAAKSKSPRSGFDVYAHQEDEEVEGDVERENNGDMSRAPVAAVEQTTVVPDQTTLITNDAEAFALGPVDVTAVGTERKAKKKRKLIIDDAKSLSSTLIRAHLARTADIVAPLDLAPPKKKLMIWKEVGSVEKVLILPTRPLMSSTLLKLFTNNLTTRPEMNENESVPVEDQVQDIETGRAALHGGESTPARRFTRSSFVDEVEAARLSLTTGNKSLVANHSRLETIEPPEIRLSLLADRNTHRHSSTSLIDSIVAGPNMSITNITAGPGDLSLPSPPTIANMPDLPALPPSTPLADRTLTLNEPASKSTTATVQHGNNTSVAVASTSYSTPVGPPHVVRKSPGDKTPSRRILTLPSPRASASPYHPQSPNSIATLAAAHSLCVASPFRALLDEGPMSIGGPRSMMSVIGEENEDAIFNIKDRRLTGVYDSRQMQRQLEEDDNEAERRVGKRITRMLEVLHQQMNEATSRVGEMDKENGRRNSRLSKGKRSEERVLSSEQVAVSFNDLVVCNNRKQVAAKFYTFLVLRKLQAVDVKQEEPFGDIIITKGPKFDAMNFH